MAAIRLGPDCEVSCLVFAELGIREERLQELNSDTGGSALQEEMRPTNSSPSIRPRQPLLTTWWRRHHTRNQLQWVDKRTICLSVEWDELYEGTTRVERPTCWSFHSMIEDSS